MRGIPIYQTHSAWQRPKGILAIRKLYSCYANFKMYTTDTELLSYTTLPPKTKVGLKGIYSSVESPCTFQNFPNYFTK